MRSNIASLVKEQGPVLTGALPSWRPTTINTVVTRFPSLPRQVFQIPQQSPAIRSSSLPSTHLPFVGQTQLTITPCNIPPMAMVAPNQKTHPSSLQIMLSIEENELKQKQRQLNDASRAMERPKKFASASKSMPERNDQPKEVVTHSIGRLSLGGGSRSAFRPFLKQTDPTGQSMPINRIRPTILSTK
jgi:hypothetical protein